MSALIYSSWQVETEPESSEDIQSYSILCDKNKRATAETKNRFLENICDTIKKLSTTLINQTVEYFSDESKCNEALIKTELDVCKIGKIRP